MGRKFFGKSAPEKAGKASGTISWDESGFPFFSMGEGTLKVPMAMHAEHREKLCSALRETLGAEKADKAILLFQGGTEIPKYDTDTNFDFKQESNFQYLFGVKEPGCIGMLRVRDAHSTLLVPRFPTEYAKWLGPIKPPVWFHGAYSVDEACHTDEALETIKKMGAVEGSVITMQYVDKATINRDSGKGPMKIDFDGSIDILNAFGASTEDSVNLYETINECRFIKTKSEIKLMEFVNEVSSLAHIETMRAVKGGLTREHLAEATFKYQSALRGCFRVGYNCICGSAYQNAVLHYGHAAEPNSEIVPSDSLRLLDMGAEYHCYTADVTCSFPTSGKFTDGQRAVYNAVWQATKVVESTLKPGVCYKEMHKLAQRTMLAEMTKYGLFKGDVDKMMEVGLCSYFMAHGLGHTIGLDVHDVAGFYPGKHKGEDPTIKENLRLAREMVENMVLTVEPGFYFVEYLIKAALENPESAQFINEPVLRQLWAEVGGIRIEDGVRITANGCKVLTCVPRTAEEIEGVMAGGEWVVSNSRCREYEDGRLV